MTFRCTATAFDENFVGEGTTRAAAKAAAKVKLYAELYDPQHCSKRDVLGETEFVTVQI